jgi:hypothetical protein
VAALVAVGSAVGLGSIANAEPIVAMAPQPARGLKPTPAPTFVPRVAPTLLPKGSPSAAPTTAPSATPSAAPTTAPSATPSAAPSAAPTTAPSPSATPFTSGEIATILGALNAERALPRTPASTVPVTPLAWDANLASTALAWASTCTLGHNPGRATTGFTSVGETIWGTTLPYSTALPSQAVAAWVAEKSLYTYAKVNSSNVASTARYSQIIWQNTSKVGCARATCPSAPSFKTILVCNYGNSGNFLDQYPYPAAGFP